MTRVFGPRCLSDGFIRAYGDEFSVFDRHGLSGRVLFIYGPDDAVVQNEVRARLLLRLRRGSQHK